MTSGEQTALRVFTRIMGMICLTIAVIVCVNVLTPNKPQPPRTFIEQVDEACGGYGIKSVNIKLQTFTCDND